MDVKSKCIEKNVPLFTSLSKKNDVPGVIVVGVVTGKNPDQGAEKGSDDPGHAPDPDTVIEAKAGKSCALSNFFPV